eukprot:c25971_g6_i1 orf=3-197(-)
MAHGALQYQKEKGEVSPQHGSPQPLREQTGGEGICPGDDEQQVERDGRHTPGELSPSPITVTPQR